MIHAVVKLKASKEDQMGDFQGGGLGPGLLRLSRGFPQGGRSLGYRPGASINQSKFDIPIFSTDVVDNNPKQVYFQPKIITCFNNEIFL